MASRSDRRDRWLWLAIPLVLAVVMIGLWRCGRSESRETTASGSVEGAGSSSGSSQLPIDRAPPRDPPAVAAGKAEPPIIDAIEVEKTEVCEGEENLITVRAHTRDNKDDAYLRYKVSTLEGNPAALRVHIRDTQSQFDPPRMISVFGRNNEVTYVPICVEQPSGWNTCGQEVRSDALAARFKLKECAPTRLATIQYRILPNGWDEFEFHVQIANISAEKPLHPVSYEWDFGDGTPPVVTQTPLVSHSFEHRDSATTLTSSFLVRVKITGDDGEILAARKGVELFNDAFEHLAMKGIVLIKTVPTPRFPVLDEDGVVRQRIRIWHHHDQPVTLQRVIRQPLAEGNQPPSEAPDTLSPEQLLGTSVIQVGEAIEIDVEFDTEAHPDIFAVRYEMKGESADGWRARGGFSMLKPPPVPTRDNNTPVRDPLLAAKIKKAMEVLDKQTVTDEDLWRLEKEGVFDGLQPIDNLDPQADWQPDLPKGRGEVTDDSDDSGDDPEAGHSP